MTDNARQQFNKIYTRILTDEYEKTVGEGLLKMCRLIDDDTDKMSIRLLLQLLGKNRAKMQGKIKLDIAEELIGKDGEICAGVAFVAFLKGDREASRIIRDTAAELCAEAISSDIRLSPRAEELTALCDEFTAKEKKLSRMKTANDIMSIIGLFSGKNAEK